ncbi:hypothetical protein RFI_23219 [Reticulomyxa filosa]|uniref:Defective in cullin neddylation protein n=1 Tax=Reticulomyxa filosa TaxID=46433 RepID=X6MKH4_RETFI|nr:hypothetical protein RFI_23219 [Reticulomyxa filosa]|eukprot:ETO14151.1 hypothetical protein RFI_23219 [Reticulomyxa filosa]
MLSPAEIIQHYRNYIWSVVNFFNDKKSKTKKFKDITGNLSDSTAQKILEANKWDVQAALNDFFNNASKYEGEKKIVSSAPDKMTTLFDKYADKDDKEIMSEAGTLQFFKDIGINPNGEKVRTKIICKKKKKRSNSERIKKKGFETLAVAWLLNSSEMGLIQRKEFVDGFSGQACLSTQDIKSVVKAKLASLETEVQFRQFYKFCIMFIWVFQHVKEDEKKKTIPVTLAVQVWKIALGSKQKELPLLEKWIAWCEQSKDVNVVNRDVWEQVYDFLKETKTLNTYDDSGAWPVQIDEFIAWAKEQH